MTEPSPQGIRIIGNHPLRLSVGLLCKLPQKDRIRIGDLLEKYELPAMPLQLPTAKAEVTAEEDGSHSQRQRREAERLQGQREDLLLQWLDHCNPALPNAIVARLIETLHPTVSYVRYFPDRGVLLVQ
jgi:hypothetical protein